MVKIKHKYFISVVSYIPFINSSWIMALRIYGENCTMDKINRDGENKTQILYKCCSIYSLYKLIVDNGIEDLWGKENPDSSEFICYDRSFAKDQYRPSVLIFGKGRSR